MCVEVIMCYISVVFETQCVYISRQVCVSVAVLSIAAVSAVGLAICLTIVCVGLLCLRSLHRQHLLTYMLAQKRVISYSNLSKKVALIAECRPIFSFFLRADSQHSLVNLQKSSVVEEFHTHTHTTNV